MDKDEDAQRAPGAPVTVLHMLKLLMGIYPSTACSAWQTSTDQWERGLGPMQVCVEGH